MQQEEESINRQFDEFLDEIVAEHVESREKSKKTAETEKAPKAEKTDEILFQKVRERGEELDIIYRDLQRDINQVEKRLLL